jgi:hypothetical protein
MAIDVQTEGTKGLLLKLVDSALIISIAGALFYVLGYTYHDAWLTKLGIPTRSVDISVQTITLYGCGPMLGLLVSFAVCMGLVTSVQSLWFEFAKTFSASVSEGSGVIENKTGTALRLYAIISIALTGAVLTLALMASNSGQSRGEVMLAGRCGFFKLTDELTRQSHIACYVDSGKDGDIWFIELVSEKECRLKPLSVRHSSIASMISVDKPAQCGE